MIDTSVLKALGWSEELINEVARIARDQRAKFGEPAGLPNSESLGSFAVTEILVDGSPRPGTQEIKAHRHL